MALANAQSIRDQTTDGTETPIENGHIDHHDEPVEDPYVTFTEEYPD